MQILSSRVFGVCLVALAVQPQSAAAAQGLGFYAPVEPDVAILADGRIVAALASDDAIVVARYDNDGTLDTTFAEEGFTRTPNDKLMGAPAVGVQPDGKILVAGTSTDRSDLVVARYAIDGSLDSTFGGDGIVQSDLGNVWVEARDIVAQPDGKIIVAARSFSHYVSETRLVRYNTDGNLDADFGAGGVVSMNFRDASAISIQADDKVVVAGERDGGGFISRHNVDGSLDASFDDDGVSLAPSGPVIDLALQSDGRILAIVGRRIERYDVNGALEETLFDLNTIGYGYLTSIAVQPDDAFLVAGMIGYPNKYAVLGLRSDGTLDSDFANNGSFVLESNGFYNAIAVGLDGAIVAVGIGTYEGGTTRAFTVARLTASGDGDTGFDDDGIVFETDCRRVPLNDPACIQAGRATVILRRAPRGNNRLRWKWRGEDKGLEHSDLGNPRTDTQYTLCVYDTFAGVPTLRSWNAFKVYYGWSEDPSDGWLQRATYYNTPPKGSLSFRLTARGGESRPSVRLSHVSRGGSFGLANAVSSAAYFNQQSTVTFQLVSSDGICMTSEFPVASTKTNDGGEFSAAVP